MVWTSEEVDRYVSKTERTIASTKEREMKSFSFAKLYKEARDHDSAQRHLAIYISTNESDFRGHRMMGQLLEDTGDHAKAVEAYRRSLELNNTQNDLVLKVVELYRKVPTEPQRARVWADRAARLFPGNLAVFKLRMHLLECSGQVDYEEMEDLISEEMVKRPGDVALHIRLVRMYSITGRLADAFSHCVSINGTSAFCDSLEWWTCVVEIFEKYLASQERLVQEDQELIPGHSVLEAHSNLLWALCSVANLHLSHSGSRDCANPLYRFDYSLLVAFKRRMVQLPQIPGSKESEWAIGLQEMRAQLYMHCGTFLIKLAKENYLSWPRSLKMACACYATSVAVGEPSNTPQVPGMTPKKKDSHKWHTLACCRLSHVGHVLTAMKNRHGEEWLENCILDGCTPQGLSQIINSIYDGKDISMSFVGSDDEFQISEIKLPSLEELINYDEVALGQNPENLQMLLWIGLHWYQLDKSMKPGVGVVVSRIFDGLMMDVHNIEQAAADTLCHRDLEAFVYAVVRTAGARLLEDQDVHYEDFQPHLLPQPLCPLLSLPVQSNWWSAAYSLYTGTSRTLQSGKARATVQRGLEMIRALGNHGLHVRLLVYLANNFGEKGAYLKSSGPTPWHYKEHWKSLEDRSVHYWKEALATLEKIEKDESIPYCKDPLFPQLPDIIQKEEVQYNLQNARLTLGEVAVKEGRLEDAIELFVQVKTPRGIWNLAQVYKYYAGMEAQAATEETGTDCTNLAREYYTFLNNARNLLLSGLQMLSPDDLCLQRRRETFQEGLNEIEDMLNADPTRINTSRKHLDFRQLDYQASRSSTAVSEVQDSEGDFWLEQPQDSSTKDLIAKLSEVTLNNGYLQEQMALRDEQMSELAEHVRMLQSEVQDLKHSRYQSDSTLNTPNSLPAVLTLGAAVPSLMSTPVARPSSGIKSRLGPRLQAGTPSPLPEGKIDSSFFAGLSKSNSPEVYVQAEEEVDGDVSGQRSRDVSVSSMASQDDGIHFEPLIPLPEKIEVETGEEQEDVLFTGRAKLFRFDKETSSWKERGIGDLKILNNSATGKFRVLMRRENIHKVCANHFITSVMNVRLKAESANSLMWTTFADYADEIPKVEQLAAKFKTPEDAAAFMDTFEEARETLRNTSISQTESDTEGDGEADKEEKEEEEEDDDDDEKDDDEDDDDDEEEYDDEDDEEPRERFVPGAWSCSECSVLNSPETTKCVACGTAKLALPVSIADASKMSFPFQLSQFAIQRNAPDSLVAAPTSPGTSDTAGFVFGTGSPSGEVVAPQHHKSSPSSNTATTSPQPSPAVFGSSCSQVEPVSFTSFSPKGPPSFGVKLDDRADQTKATQPVETGSFSYGTPEQGAVPLQKLFWQQPTGPSPFSKTDAVGSKANPRLPASQALAYMVKSRENDAKGKVPSLQADVTASPPSSAMCGTFSLSSEEDFPYDFTPYVTMEADDGKALNTSQMQVKSGFVVEECDRDEGDVVHGIIDESDSESESDNYSNCSTEAVIGLETGSRPGSAESSCTPVKIESNDSPVVLETQPPVAFSPQTSSRRILTPRSTLRSAKKKDEDCIIVYEIRTSRAERDRATSLLLPTNFYNYKRADPCPGCQGCCEAESGLNQGSREREPTRRPDEERPETSQEGGPIFGQSHDFTALSFSSVASTSKGAFCSLRAGGMFAQAGAQIFDVGQGNEGDGTEGGIHFEPIIPLPEKITVVTGEEGMDMLFCERAKLYRFDKDNSMWKERGVGEMKLLRDCRTGCGRVIMRRDQIKKLCANHIIDVDMELKPNVGSSCSWVWSTLADYSDGTARTEQLAVRFKTPELAARFKDAFDDIKKHILDKSHTTAEVYETDLSVSEDVAKDVKLIAVGCTTDGAFGTSAVEDLKVKFAPDKDSWSCDSCYTQNVSPAVVCAACLSPRIDGMNLQGQSKSQVPEVQELLSSFSARTHQSFSSSTAPQKSGSVSAFAFGREDSSSTFNFSMPLFSIGQGDPTKEDEKQQQQGRVSLSPTRISSPFKVENDSTALAAATSPTRSVQTDLPFGTESPCKFTFKLQFSPVSPSRQAKSPQSPTSPLGPASPTSPGAESEDDRIHFEPLIPLPDKVDHHTGEENEVDMFCERAKLFRFDKDTAQWKERGIGEMKILHHKDSKTYRLLMRREHVFKICCNHRLNSSMTLKSQGGLQKSWMWHTAADFADEVARPEMLAIKFGSCEKAQEFKHVFERAQRGDVAEERKDIADSGQAAGVEDQSPIEGGKNENQGWKAGGNQDRQEGKEEPRKEDQVLHASPKPSVVAKEKTSQPPTGFLFGSPTVSSLSFAGVARSSSSSPYADNTTQKSPGVPGVGQKLFGSPQTEGEDDKKCASLEDDGPHFQPIIALPEKIKVSTGEENEEVLFSHRAKLYRFDKDANQWKERGVGNIKLLHSNKTGKIRVLMRRDQVLKVCANHQVTAGTKLQPNAGSDKSWVWHTMADFTEEEPKPEKLAVKFKSAEVAKQFKGKFDECLEILSLANSQESGHLLIHKRAQQSNNGNILQYFKPKAGSWDCEMCLVNNRSDETACVACGTSKPGKGEDTAPGTSVFDRFKPKASSWDCEMCLVNNRSEETACVACGTLKPGKGEETTSGTSSFDKFKPKAGSWDCEICLVNNRSEETACVACGSRKPGQCFGQSTSSEQTKFQFQFGAQAAQNAMSGFAFGGQPIQSDGRSKFAFGTTSAKPSMGSTFVFGGTPGTTDTKAADSSSSAGFVFRGPLDKTDTNAAYSSSSAAFLFGYPPGTTDAKTADSGSSAGFVFGGPPGKTDTKAAESGLSAGVVFGDPPGKTDTKAADSSSSPAFVFGDPPGKTDTKAADSNSSAGFVFGDPRGKTDTKAADSSSSAGFVFGDPPGKTDTEAANTDFVFGASPGESRLTQKARDSEGVIDGALSEEPQESLEGTSSGGAQSQSHVNVPPPEHTNPKSPETEVIFIDLELVEAPEPTIVEVERAENLLLPKSFYLYERTNKTSEKEQTFNKGSGSTDEQKESVGRTVDTSTEVRDEGRETTDDSTDVFGAHSVGSLQSFASMVKSPTDRDLFSKPSHTGFRGQGAQLFTSHRSPGAEGEDYDPEKEGGSEFRPVVSLPEVEKITGEENEIVRFSHRAKLYRFDTELGQWKERGVGDIKILQHKEMGRSRILMRREQIHKLCANHYIVPDMELRPNLGSDRSWVWHAQDFSEEVMRPQQLAVKFKKVSIAEHFRDAFYESKSRIQPGSICDVISENIHDADSSSLLQGSATGRTESREQSDTTAEAENRKQSDTTEEAENREHRNTTDEAETREHSDTTWEAETREESDTTEEADTREHSDTTWDADTREESDTTEEAENRLQSDTTDVAETREESDTTEADTREHSDTTWDADTREESDTTEEAENRLQSDTTDEAETREESDTTEADTREHSDTTWDADTREESDTTEEAENRLQSDTTDEAETREESDTTEEADTREHSDTTWEADTREESDTTEEAENRLQSDTTDEAETREQSDTTEEAETREQSDTIGEADSRQQSETTGEGESLKPIGEKGEEGHDKTSTGLFGSSSVSSLSFADVVSNMFSSKSPPKKSALVDSPIVRPPGVRRGEESDNSEAEDGVTTEHHVHFEAVIPLPEEIVVVTGEEEEEVVFQERCKLYRYDKEASQWKERGVGIMKILRDPGARRARVVMRRDQIHKLCANHLITPQMNLKPNGQSEKAWTWQTLADVSDGGEGKVEQVAVRFKTKEIAQEFKEKFEDCQGVLNSDGQDPGEDEETTDTLSLDTEGVTQEEPEKSFATRSTGEENTESPSIARVEAASADSPTNTAALLTCSPEISELLEEIHKQDPDVTRIN